MGKQEQVLKALEDYTDNTLQMDLRFINVCTNDYDFVPLLLYVEEQTGIYTENRVDLGTTRKEFGTVKDFIDWFLTFEL